MKDEIFKTEPKKQFEFDEVVASVFDDMVSRSVPFYKEALVLACDFLALRLPQNARVVDLGCSTASTLLYLARTRGDLLLTGIDNSKAMLEVAKNKAAGFGARLNLVLGDILTSDFSGCDAVVLNYSLQFVRPPKRAAFLRKIYESLNSGGVLVLSEKLVFENGQLAKEMIALYESYKERQGYTKTEIATKRAALENVLVPFTRAENETLCREAGFTRFETLFCWGNFASFLVFKE